MSDYNVNVIISGPNNEHPATYKTFILRGNTSFADQVTEPNTKYVIKWDFNLNGETVTVPENCILEFDGGVLHDGTIVGQDTFINDIGGLGLEKLFAEDIVREGTWRTNGGGSFVQVQSDWNQTNVNKPDYIKNKPNIPEGVIVDTELSKTSTNPVQNKVITEALENAGGNPDKPYDPTEHSGLGRKTLELKEDGSNVLTQEDFSDANTIYVVQYDFDLDGGEIDVPDGCIIRFDGGSINNGTFRFNGATVEGEPKGTALYGVVYKDGQPLLYNYNRALPPSQVFDFAFFCQDSAVVYSPISVQSICVTKDYIFCVGNKHSNEDCGIIALFDRNLNFIGQCGMVSAAHGSGSTIINNKLYVVHGGTRIGYAELDDIVTACRNSRRHTSGSNTDPYIPELSDTYITVSGVAYFGSIDYDPIREEIAIFFYGDNIGDNTPVYLAILDSNFNLKKKYNIDMSAYVTEHFVGVNNVSSFTYYRGTFGDIIYRNGIILATYWYCYNYSTHTVEMSGIVEIDANTSTPISYLGKYEDLGPQMECEGIAIDPDDDSVLWVNGHCHYDNDTAANTRTQTIWIGRISFSKQINSTAIHALKNQKDNPISIGTYSSIYVDNSYTGLSTGNHQSPYKTLETAIILCSGFNTKRFCIRPTSTNYTLSRFSIASNVKFERWLNEGDSESLKPVIDKTIIRMQEGGKLELDNISIVGDINRESAVIRMDGGKLIVSNTDIVASTTTQKLLVGVDMYDGATISLKGTCSISNFYYGFILHSGSTIAFINTLNVTNCGAVYRFDNTANVCANSLSSLVTDNTVSKLYEVIADNNDRNLIELIEHVPSNLTSMAAFESYASSIMSRAMNNPNIVRFRSTGSSMIPYGYYIYTPQGLQKVTDVVQWGSSFKDAQPDSHDNELRGTGNIKILNSADYFTHNRSEWRKRGSYAIPQEVTVSVMNIEHLTGGMRFTAKDQCVAKDFSLTYDKGWCVFSALAKGSGTILMGVMMSYTGSNNQRIDTYKEMSYTLDNANEWKLITRTMIIPDAVDLTWPAIVYFVTTSQSVDITVCAPKLEMSSSPTQWTPNRNDYPKGGTTDNRPINVEVGYQYFDTTLNKTIVYNGTVWVNIDGTPLT